MIFAVNQSQMYCFCQGSCYVKMLSSTGPACCFSCAQIDVQQLKPRAFGLLSFLEVCSFSIHCVVKWQPSNLQKYCSDACDGSLRMLGLSKARASRAASPDLAHLFHCCLGLCSFTPLPGGKPSKHLKRNRQLMKVSCMYGRRRFSLPRSCKGSDVA